MAKTRTPTNVLKLRGADKVHPERMRDRANEPEPEGDVGDPPDYFSDEQRACWIELIGHCHEGVLCAADRPFMEYAARVWAEIRADAFIDPKMGIRFETICARLGMTPADRSKVQARKKDGGKDPYSEFGGATG